MFISLKTFIYNKICDQLITSHLETKVKLDVCKTDKVGVRFKNALKKQGMLKDLKDTDYIVRFVEKITEQPQEDKETEDDKDIQKNKDIENEKTEVKNTNNTEVNNTPNTKDTTEVNESIEIGDITESMLHKDEGLLKEKLFISSVEKNKLKVIKDQIREKLKEYEEKTHNDVLEIGLALKGFSGRTVNCIYLEKDNHIYAELAPKEDSWHPVYSGGYVDPYDSYYEEDVRVIDLDEGDFIEEGCTFSYMLDNWNVLKDIVFELADDELEEIKTVTEAETKAAGDELKIKIKNVLSRVFYIDVNKVDLVDVQDYIEGYNVYYFKISFKDNEM